VPNTKVVLNIPVHLQKNFHNFLRSLSIFLDLFTPEYLEIDLEKEKGFFLFGLLSAALAQTREVTGPLLFPLSHITAKWASRVRV
jgi:hypothetical protein